MLRNQIVEAMCLIFQGDRQNLSMSAIQDNLLHEVPLQDSARWFVFWAIDEKIRASKTV